MPRQQVFTGDNFGSWEVIEYRPVRSLCRCACGRTEKLCHNAYLKNGATTACKQCGLDACHEAHLGLKMRKVLKDLPDEVYRKLFQAVNNVIARCTHPMYVQWKDYGGRGITIYGPWLEDKYKFIEYLASLPGASDPELILDRAENDGNYEPGNLRFVTRSLSNFNRRPFTEKRRKA